MQLVSVEKAEALATADRVLFETKEAAPGELWIDLAVLGTGEAFRGSGPLALMTFDTEGEIDLAFAECDLRSVDNTEMNPTVHDLALRLEGARPAATRLIGVQPNPFNPTTTVRYQIHRPGPVTLQVYDARGRRVAVLVDESLAPGHYAETWHGRDDNGYEVASGTYFIRMSTATYERTIKAVMLK